MTIPAKYEDGVFEPLYVVTVEEGTIVEVVVPGEKLQVSGKSSVRNLPFYGLWKDRADIGDGIDYVDRLRDNPQPQALAEWPPLVDTDVMIELSPGNPATADYLDSLIDPHCSGRNQRKQKPCHRTGGERRRPLPNSQKSVTGPAQYASAIRI